MEHFKIDIPDFISTPTVAQMWEVNGTMSYVLLAFFTLPLILLPFSARLFSLILDRMIHFSLIFRPFTINYFPGNRADQVEG